MTISSWLNFAVPCPGKGSAAGRNLCSALLQPACSVCVPLGTFYIAQFFSHEVHCWWFLWLFIETFSGLFERSCCPLLGGAGFGDIEDCIIAEEIAYGCSGIATTIIANSLAVSERVKCGWWIGSMLKDPVASHNILLILLKSNKQQQPLNQWFSVNVPLMPVLLCFF